MRYSHSFSFLILSSLLFSTSCSKGGPGSQPIPERPEMIHAEPISLQVPKPEIWELPNGLKVYYSYDPELPVVSAHIMFGGGSLFDPAPVSGLFSALGSEMRDGGAGSLPPAALDKELDELAASIESSYGGDYGSVGFGCLTEDVDRVFSLFADVIRKPRFDEMRLKLWKEASIQSIKRRRESGDVISGLAFGSLVYGPDSPYGSISTEASISKVTRAALVKAHGDYVVPTGAQLIVTGDIKRDRLEKLINEKLGDWFTAKSAIATPPLPAVGLSAAPGVYVIQHDFDQASILMGHLGPPRIYPEIVAGGIYSRIVGANAFSSRLMQEIRTNLGLAYNVFGAILPAAGKGTFQVEMGTRNEEAVRALVRAIEIVRESTVTPPTATELDESKRGIEQSFVFKFASPEAVTQRVALQNRFGFPADFDDKYLKTVEGTAPADVLNAAKQWVDADKLIIVMTGKMSAEETAAKLKSLGLNIPVYKMVFDSEPKLVGRVN